MSIQIGKIEYPELVEQVFTGDDLLEFGIEKVEQDQSKGRQHGYHCAWIGQGCFAAKMFKKSSEEYREFLNWKDTIDQEFTSGMADDILSILPKDQFYDVVTVPPTARTSEYPAGFLGKLVATELGFDFVTLFNRTGEKKKWGPKWTQEYRESDLGITLVKNIRHKSILLIDDLIATGKTLKICSEKLRECQNNVTAVAWARLH